VNKNKNENDWLFMHETMTITRVCFFSAANFAKFCCAVCEIPRHYYLHIPYILQPVRVVLLTVNTSKYNEFIVTCNTKTHYIRPLMMKILP